MATAFNSQGATPSAPQFGVSSPGYTNSYNLGNLAGGSPFSKALNNMGSTQSTTPAAPAIQPPKPSTPLKSVTQTNPDGSSTAYTYHPSTTGTTSGMLSSPPTQTNADANISGGGPSGISSTGQAIANPQTSTGLVLPGQTSSSAAPAYSASNPPTFPGLLGQAANMANTTNPTTATAQSNLLNTTQNGPFVSNEQGILGQEAALQPGYLSQLSQLTSNPGDLADYNTRLSALQQGYGTEMSGLGAELTAANAAQGTQQSGYNEAGTLGTNQQQVQQQGLNSAAGQAQPSTAAFGQAVFNPTTGSYTNSGGLPDSVMAQYAQMAANGQYSAIPSSITSNPVLSAQLNAAAQQINPNYNPITSTAQGAAQASNVQTGGTAATGAAAGGYTTAVQNYNTANAQYETTNQQAQTLQNIMAQTGVNAVGSQYANQTVNALKNQFGSANYTAFITALTEAQNTYSTLLSTTGATTPTINGQSALTILSPNSTPAQITAAIQQLQNAAYNKLQPMYQLIGTYQSQLGTQNGTNSNSSQYGW